MDIDTFRRSTADAAPPAGLAAPLAGLWWAAKGDWEKAHAIVQAHDTPHAAWVHAYLHRVEGDLDNARYWYARAKKPPATERLEDEWLSISQTLLRGEASA
ncbi:MAG: hypothetical protein AB7O60_09805 [Variibacter sp.]